MNLHTLTPELQFYVFTILSTWCLSSSNLASHVYSRCFVSREVNPLVVQCIFKGFICLILMWMISLNNLFETSVWLQLISIPLGFLLGRFVVAVELAINRFIQRRTWSAHKSSRKTNYYYAYAGPTSMISSLASSYRPYNTTNIKKLHEHYAEHEIKTQNFSLIIILAIAVFEEIIFRGYLVQFCYLLPKWSSHVALIMTVMIFGISHASVGMKQIISKIILGGCCMAAVLICHTVLPALIIHGYLNWVAFYCQTAIKKQQRTHVDSTALY